MNTLRQAAQQALEALESSRIFVITREKTKHPEGTEWYDSAMHALRTALEQPEQECWCHKCNENRLVNNIPFSATRMILCPTCGNKRCPKASDHRLDCTDSNEPNQPGSLYTTPPAAQRPWVDLTDEDVNRESAPITSQMKLAFHAGMYVAQQVLKERNT